VLLLDAGNVLFGQQPLTQQSQGKILIDAMNLLGYNAMAIGNMDLQWGPDVLRQRIADAKFPVLSANVVVAADGKLLAEPYVVMNVGGRKVGIVGLTWDQAQTADPAVQAKFLILQANETLAKYVSELSKQTDIIIVLSNMGWEEDQLLSSAIPGIDVIVGSRTSIPATEAWRNPETGTLIVQAGFQGEWIGRRSLQIDSAGVVTNNQDELIYLTEDVADDPETRAFLDNYRVP
jgi:5'-nucleotidase/UDP-sugar diphosphatase